MTVPFGFSIGDVIAGIRVIKTTVDALHSTRGASKDYQQLSSALQTLNESLDTVETIPLDPHHDAQQSAAIISAVQRCQQTIDSFLECMTKFELLKQTDLSSGWSTRVVAVARKIQWAVCKKEDIAKFTEDLHKKIEEIGLLIATLQVYRTHREVKRQAEYREAAAEHHEILRRTQLAVNQSQVLIMEQQKSLEMIQIKQAQLVQESANQSYAAQNNSDVLRSLQQMLMNELSPHHRDIVQFILGQQAKVYQESEARLLRCIRDLPKQIQLHSTIPPQILLQQPVTFVDANGHAGLIHLDFINCFEAFHAVLKVRFKDCGLAKVERQEFTITDPHKNEILNVSESWDRFMKPGQHRAMNMVFILPARPRTSCPACSTENKSAENAEIVCKACGLVYYQKVATDLTLSKPAIRDREVFCLPERETTPPSQPAPKMHHDDAISEFRRVHLICLPTRRRHRKKHNRNQSQSFESLLKRTESLSTHGNQSYLENTYQPYLYGIGYAGLLHEQYMAVLDEHIRLQYAQEDGQDLSPKDIAWLGQSNDVLKNTWETLQEVKGDGHRLRTLFNQIAPREFNDDEDILKWTDEKEHEYAHFSHPQGWPWDGEITPEIDRESKDLLNNFIEGDPNDRINRWLLHKVRSSFSEVELLRRVQEESSNLPSYDTERWQVNVLAEWYEDITDFLPSQFSVDETASSYDIERRRADDLAESYEDTIGIPPSQYSGDTVTSDDTQTTVIKISSRPGLGRKAKSVF